MNRLLTFFGSLCTLSKYENRLIYEAIIDCGDLTQGY